MAETAAVVQPALMGRMVYFLAQLAAMARLAAMAGQVALPV